MINHPALLIVRLKWFLSDYLLVLFIGLGFFLFSYLTIYQGPVISDEIVYAVVARNIVEGTLNTNLYRTDSIVLRGYPTRDVHVPGYMLTLAISLAVFGINNFALGLPGQVAYILSGLVFYRVGKSLFGSKIAILATILFYAYPINWIFSNLIMVESSLTLLSVIYLAIWVKLSQEKVPSLSSTVILAVVVVVGMTFRQTFIAFLPPALLLLLKSSLTKKQFRPLVVFCLVFVLLLLALYMPLAQNRSYYPIVFDEILAAGRWDVKVVILAAHFLSNLEKTFNHLTHFRAETEMALLNLVLGLGSVLGMWLTDRSQKRLAFLALYLYWLPSLLLLIFYVPMTHFTFIRQMGTFILPALLVVPAVIFQLRQQMVRWGGVAILLVGVGFTVVAVTQGVETIRFEAASDQQRISSLITKYLQPYEPHTILFKGAFNYAWEHYPTIIIWSPPTTEEEMRILEERLPLDGIVVSTEEERDIIVNASAIGLLKRKYTLLFPYRVEDHYFFVSEHLLNPVNKAADQ